LIGTDNPWIELTGGGNYFAPSLRGIKYLAAT
jgi:hypothetical protein